jgi:cytochrome c551/c552
MSLAILTVLLLTAGDADPSREKAVALLESRCGSCHGSDKQKGGLRLDSRAALMKGGETGVAVVPGDPDRSLLVQAVRQTSGDLRMPPKEKLTADQVELLVRWVREGAVWPEPTSARAASGPLGDAWTDPRNPIVRLFGGKRLDLWSLRKAVRPEPPPVREASRVRTPVDRFIFAALDRARLAPSPEADRQTLIRRVTLDLTGLPPTPEEIRAFEEDAAPDAYEALVDRLLASPRYGERWARHWLDVVRYADSNGFERDEFQPQIYRYRDYVIRAFNSDKPYDVFIREQLAGDEMVTGPPRDAADVDRLVATGYLRLGPYDSTGSIFEENAKNRNELMTDLANTTGSAFLGLTVSCANCHDHKYDPISQADHFRLRAFFSGLKRVDDAAIDLAPVHEQILEHNRRVEARVKEYEAEAADVLAPVRQSMKPKIEDKEVVRKLPSADRKRYDELQKTIAAEKADRRESTRAMIGRDSSAKPPATPIFYQGDFTQPREEVPPGFLSALDPNPAAIEPPRGLDSSGRRTALAAWIASPGNPLTARVLVNRLWLHHFGKGLVSTPNDFGMSGARPTDPALLDWLASELTSNGWSLKHLHRVILRSSTYRQVSRDDPAGRAVDPDNRLLWRQNVRRLEAEATRDAVLAVSGLLLPKDAGAPVWPPVPQDLLDAQPGILETHSDKAAQDRLQGWYAESAEKSDVRSIFLVQKRALGTPFLLPFDLPDPTVSCGRRDCTTVAPQALQLLNSPFAERAAVAFARRVEREGGGVERAVRLALGRPPTEEESRLGREVAGRRGVLADWCRVLLNLNEFVYVD